MQVAGTRGPVRRPVNTWYQKGVPGAHRFDIGVTSDTTSEDGSEKGPPNDHHPKRDNTEPQKGLKGEQVRSGRPPTSQPSTTRSAPATMSKITSGRNSKEAWEEDEEGLC